MIEKIREINKLQKELYSKHNVAIVSYPGDPIRVLVYGFDKIIEIANEVTFEKIYDDYYKYRATAIVEDIEFEAYATKTDYEKYKKSRTANTENTKKVVPLTRQNKKGM